MQDQIAFETPENVQVSYRSAGLGTRFVAWFADQLILLLVRIVIIIFILGSLFANIGDFFFDESSDLGGGETLYLVGICLLVLSLLDFIYFGLTEYLMGGQTPGKRSVSIRVVKVDGFSLDAPSILIRNIFRVLDHLPPLWVVPFLSKNSQRLGDMVAGTGVILDKQTEISSLRHDLLDRPVDHMVFRFDSATLKRGRPEDFEAVERILERYRELPDSRRLDLLAKVCDPIAARLKVEPPPPDQRLTFLIDLLAAELRRQHRELS